MDKATPYLLTQGERAVLEARCSELTKGAERTGQGSWFIGTTADRDGTGHALCYVNGNGRLSRAWGTAAELHSILDEHDRNAHATT